MKRWPENQPLVAKWLCERNARCLWNGKIFSGATLHAYTVNGHVVLFQEFRKGWAVFVAASDAINVRETFAAVDERIQWKEPEKA